MATLRSYSATFEQTALASAAVARWRFNEGAGATATDSVAALDGSYEPGAAPGAAGSIGDGAASFNGSGFVLVDSLSGTITVSAFGDSLIAGGDIVTPADRFSPNLAAALEARGLDATVVNRGVSGNTTAQGLARVDDVIGDDPDVVILELGTNDAIQDRLPLTLVEDDLRDIITALRAEDIQVLVTGTFGWYPERNSGSGYDAAGNRDDFEAIFADLVAEFDDPGVVLLRDSANSDKFLGGERVPGVTPADDTISGGVLASGDPEELNIDGLHPNAAGVDVIVPRVAPQTIALGAAAGAVTEPLLLPNGSFEFWFTADSTSGQHTLASKNSVGQGTGGQFAIVIRDGGVARFALGNEQQNFVADSAAGVIVADQPTHLIATFGAGGMHVFVDGVEVASRGYTGGLDAGLGNFELLAIGAESGASTPGTVDNLVSFFDGTIDEFAIYDRALSAGEIQQLFSGGEAGSTVVGTAAADTITGGSDDEELRGAGGNDTIDGNGGDDELRGGGGSDVARGGMGDDALFGGRGEDELRGGAGADTLEGKDGGDVLAGGEGDDLLEGGAGRDELSGAGGADQLFGNKGVDELRGGAGDDLLNGGNGKDSLAGGPDADTFQIDQIGHGVDHIQDFTPGDGDVLDLSSVLNFPGGDFSGFVQLNETNGNTKVAVNPDGAGADFTTVFNLNNTTGLDLATLVNDGNVQLS